MAGMGRLLGRLLACPKEPFHALDPCARGTDLPDLVGKSGAVTWGVVELEDVRNKLGRRFSRVVIGPWYGCRAPEGAFSLLYLAPEKMGRMWLRGTWRQLAPGGILVWATSPAELDAGTVRYVCDRFADVSLWRVPSGVAVMGARKARLRADVRAERAVFDALENPPDPRASESGRYRVPAAERGIRVVPAVPAEDEARALLGASPLWRLFRRGTRRGLARPPVPLHPGHIALLLAAGHLDGAVGEGEEAHLVRGSVEQVSWPVDPVAFGDEGEGQKPGRAELCAHRTAVSVLLPGGKLKVFR